MYEELLSPVMLGNVKLKNRILFAPTSMGLSDEQMEQRIEAIAAGGCAMIILGDVPVLPARFGHSLFDRKGFRYYQKLAAIAHRHDCRICAQLHQSDSNWKGMLRYLPGILTKKLSARELRPLLNAQTGPYISGLSKKRIRQITDAFGKAAVLARKAGFDMVQVHGDRMCGSFSSAIFNRRTDEYGGSAVNRARFAVEAVSAIRRMAPDLSIDYKLAVRQENPHYGNAGVLETELGIFVPLLEQAGVSSFHVALANHSDLEDTIPGAGHPEFFAEGCFLKYCDQVRQYTKLPVCGVGGLVHPEFICRQIQDGRIQCAAMSRQLIADPNWVKKLASGEEEGIHFCLRCNKRCLGGMMEHQGVHCIYEQVKRDKKKKEE